MTAVESPARKPSEVTVVVDVEDPPPSGDGSDGKDEIRLIPFTKGHSMKAGSLTLREFPFPENYLAALTFMYTSDHYGVVAIDADDNLAGYFLGKHMYKVGLKQKKVANLYIVCVSSRHQKMGIAKQMGKYMLEDQHPDFSPDDYDEIIIQDTDVWNSSSWLFSDRTGFRYFPTKEIVRRLGITGYLQLILFQHHVMPCQFLKRRVKNEEESIEADALESEKGIVACALSGLLPTAFWAIHWVLECGGERGGIRGIFVAYLFGVVYVMLAARFLLAHTLTTTKRTPPVFREYDLWWSLPLGAVGNVLTIVAGVPLLGWTGGFYLGESGLNYLKRKNRRALGLLYLPINLLTFGLFLLHALLRIFSPGALGGTFLDVLGTAAFFFSITDLAMPTVAVPSGAMAIRRWNFTLFAVLWLSWLAVLLVSILIPRDAPRFLDLSAGACQSP